jgi:hypothetical protein
MRCRLSMTLARASDAAFLAGARAGWVALFLVAGSEAAADFLAGAFFAAAFFAAGALAAGLAVLAAEAARAVRAFAAFGSAGSAPWPPSAALIDATRDAS